MTRNSTLLKLLNENRISELVRALEENIRDDINKKNGNQNIAKVAKAIIKSAEQKIKSISFHGAWIEDGIQYVTDGYKMLALYTPIALKEAVQDGTRFSGTDIMRKARLNADRLIDTPAIGDVKAFIALQAANGEIFCRYRLINDGPMVGARYLLDILTAFPKAEIYIGGRLNPVYFKDDAGEAIIMPIRPNKETQDE